MKKHRWLLITGILLLTVPLLVAGCSSGTEEVKTQDVEETLPVNPDTSIDDADRADAEVDIANFDYSPNEITVPAGTTVIWRNADSVIHTVTSDDGIFDSGSLSNGDTFSFTFETPGIYPYHCIPHPYMKAKIIVE